MHRALLFLALSACSKDVTLDGQVVDLWGTAISDATVIQEGVGTSTKTDAYGYFSMPLTPGEVTLRVGKDGYVQTQLTVTATADAPPSPVVSLYPRPAEHGFYAIGSSSYQALSAEPVRILGNELGRVTGIQKIDTSVTKSPFEVVFDTELRVDEIARLGLALHTLTYKTSVEVPGPFDNEPVDANLYTSDGTVDFQIAPMASHNEYRITVEGGLAPGWYAFQIQDVLAPTQDTDLSAIPEAQRVAWAFEYRG